jgi:hypothetical protein
MMMIRLVTIFVTILIQVAGGEECTNNGTKANIHIYNCDGVSYQNLARDFQTEKITSFNAGSQNNVFPTIDNKIFQGMNNLEKLYLYECKIGKIDENAFADLKYLSILSLHKNRIKALHVNTFGKLGNLKELYLSENQIKELPAKLFERNLKLRKLYIRLNEIQELPAGLFGTLTELEELTTRNNKLEIIHGSTFQNNKKLRKLYLYSNKIRAVAPGTFKEFTELTVLNMNNNTCINILYGSNTSNKTIDLTQVSSDLSACYENYEAFFRELITRESESHKSSDVSTTPMLTIYAAIVTILLIIAIFVVIKLNAKIKNLGQNKFEMANRESYHYYSQADEITQPAKEMQ